MLTMQFLSCSSITVKAAPRRIQFPSTFNNFGTDNYTRNIHISSVIIACYRSDKNETNQLGY